jgi:hypothetical protein
MATLESQYLGYLKENPQSGFSFEEWKTWKFSKMRIEEDMTEWDLTLLDGLGDEDEIPLAQFYPWEIRFKDIDPDTGDISQDKLICVCPDEISANWVFQSLKMMMAEFDEPNREIYKKMTI